MANEDIRALIREAGIKQWVVAEQLNMADYAFSKRLRHELTPDEKGQIQDALKTIERARKSSAVEDR